MHRKIPIKNLIIGNLTQQSKHSARGRLCRWFVANPNGITMALMTGDMGLAL